MDEQLDHSTTTSVRGDTEQARWLERRTAIKSMAAITTLAATSVGLTDAQAATHAPQNGRGPFIAGADGTRLFYRDWGTGKPVLFCHPWGLNSDIWEYQLVELSEQGVRCIAYDRRGHGRSEDPGRGYDYETLAGDLGAVLEQLDLHDVTLVGYSMGSGEAIHYIARHGGDRIARLVLVSPVAPFREDRSRFDGLIAGLKKDRPATLTAGVAFFLGKDSGTSPPMVQWVVDQFLSASPKAAIECTRTIAANDHRALLSKVQVPVLIIQGDHDEVSLLELSGRKLAEAIQGSELRIYPGAPHGIALTHRDRFTRDLLGFVGAG